MRRFSDVTASTAPFAAIAIVDVDIADGQINMTNREAGEKKSSSSLQQFTQKSKGTKNEFNFAGEILK